MADKTRSALEGGNYKCGEHDFETGDTNAWWDHLEQTGHTEDLQGNCIFCGVKTHGYNLPFKRPPKPKGLVCDTCKVNQLGADPATVAAAAEKNKPPKLDMETGEPVHVDFPDEPAKKKKGDND